MNKKKTALCALLAVGALALTGCSPVGGAESFDTKKTLEGDISSVDVRVTSADVTIVPGTDSKIGVHFYGSATHPEDFHLSAKTDGGTLVVSVDQDHGHLLSGAQSLRLEVSVPQKTYDKWHVATSSGDVMLNSAPAKELDVETSSGDAKLSAFKGDRLTVKSSSGDQTLNDVEAASASLISSSGSVELQTFQGGRLDLNSSSGSFTLNDVSGEVKASTSSGDVKMTLKDVTKDITLQASSGDLNVRMPSSANFVIDTSTSSGTVSFNFPVQFSDNSKKTKHGIIGEGGPLLRFVTSSGDITAEKTF